MHSRPLFLPLFVLLAHIHIVSSNKNLTLSIDKHGFVYINGKTLCGLVFYEKEAAVICRQQGYFHGFTLPRNDNGGSDKYELRCKGNESSVNECTYKRSFCSRSRHYNYAGFGAARVLCYKNNTDAVIGSVELSGRVSRVTINIYGIKATVCPDTFNDNSARVICRMKGYKDGVAFDINKDSSSDIVLFGGIKCRGSELSITKCQWTHGKCDEGYAVSAGVMCYYDTAPTVQFDGSLGVYTVSIDNLTVMHCVQGQFYPHTRSAPHTKPPKHTIACKRLIFLNEEKKINKIGKRHSIFPKQMISKNDRDVVSYRCHGGWKYNLRWYWRESESFICSDRYKSSGTIYTKT